MAPNDPMAINKVGLPKTEMTDSIPSYEAAAAVRDSAIQGEQGTRPTEINVTSQIRKNDNTQKYQTGYEGINSQLQQAQFLGLTMKDVFSAQYSGEGLDHFNGTDHLGKPYQEIQQDGFAFTQMIKTGQHLNIAS